MNAQSDSQQVAAVRSSAIQRVLILGAIYVRKRMRTKLMRSLLTSWLNLERKASVESTIALYHSVQAKLKHLCLRLLRLVSSGAWTQTTTIHGDHPRSTFNLQPFDVG